MTARLVSRLGVAILAAAMAWVALWSWSGLVEYPNRFLWSALLGAFLIAAVGALGRTRLLRWYLVLPAQVAVLGLWLNHRYAEDVSRAGWVPTTESVAQVAERIYDGAVAVNTYTAPVPASHPETYAYLLATALLVLLATDLLACGLRRVPWAGLPVLVTLTVPISVLEGGLSWVVFVGTALLFVMLLATEETERVLAWGRSLTSGDRRIDSLDQVVNGSTVRGSALRIGMITAAGAMVVPLLVPVSDGLFEPGGGGGGEGPGQGSTITLRNPMVDLRRDLVSGLGIPLVEARTQGDPTYLRLTVLDQFDGEEWRPIERQLPAANRADGQLPPAPGITADTPGQEADWSLVLRDFVTTWLPTPYPTREINVYRGDWRYDARTLDIAAVDRIRTQGLRYDLTGFSPSFAPARLARAASTPVELLAPMTELPEDVPARISELAREVTAGADNDHERMVRLQSWFRNTGGFTYSLEQGGGSGLPQLVRFLTEEKVGYCEQYAAAMAVMARTLGIASRVVVGFLSPAEQADGSYLYTSDDLHAWPEMYFSGAGWVRFEPTPSSRTGQAPSWTVGSPQTAPSPTPTAPSPTPTPDQTDSEVAPEASGGDGWGPDAVAAAPWALAAVAVLVTLTVPSLARRRQRHRRLAGSAEARRVADGAWAELAATARDLGISLPPGRSVREVGAVLERRAVPGSDAIPTLTALVEFVERARYARPFTVDAATHTWVREAVHTWTEVLEESVRPRQLRVARVWPRSVFDRQPQSPEAHREPELVGATELLGRE